MLAVAIVHTFNYNRDFYIPADEVIRDRRRAHASCSRRRPESMATVTDESPTQAGEAPVFYVDGRARSSGRHSTLLGFWLYLMSDCLIFALLFATYRRARPQLRRRPVAADLFDLPLVALNTVAAAVLVDHLRLRHAGDGARASMAPTLIWLAITGLFGLGFLGIELYEFAHLIHEGADAAAQRLPVRRSSRWSARTACTSPSASSGW